MELSADHQGQALIVPVWTTEAGNDTLITVRNNSEWAVAVKVRLIDSAGTEFVAFNLYLDDDDSWTGALTASDAGTEVVTSDGSCTLVAQEMSGATPGLMILPPGPRFGYLELVEMARLPKDFGASVITPWPECQGLSERFATGEWATDPAAGLIPPPRDLGRISARVQIIDVADGGMIPDPATGNPVLSNYRSVDIMD